MRLFLRDGVYYVEFGRGKKRSLKTGDEKLAKKIYKELEKEWLAGRLLVIDKENRTTLHDFIDRYLDYRRTLNLSQSTIDMDSLALRSLAEAIGESTLMGRLCGKRVVKGKPAPGQERLEEFTRAMLAKKVRPTSINAYLRHIRAALTTALDWGFIEQKPTVKMLKTDKGLPRFLRPEEIDGILTKALEIRPDFHPMLVMYLWSGARRNELLALQWSDVHLDGESPFVILTGKGRKQRNVPLLQAVVEVLAAARKDIGPVFPQWHEDTVSHWYTDLADKAGIKSHLHDLRHTAATYMVASGIDIRIVQEILGHANLATTEIYAKVIREKLHREMEKLKFE